MFNPEGVKASNLDPFINRRFMTTKELIAEYFFQLNCGFISHREFCYFLAQSGHPMSAKLDKILTEFYDSDEYWELRKEFDRKVGSLLQSNKEIEKIVDAMFREINP